MHLVIALVVAFGFRRSARKRRRREVLWAAAGAVSYLLGAATWVVLLLDLLYPEIPDSVGPVEAVFIGVGSYLTGGAVALAANLALIERAKHKGRPEPGEGEAQCPGCGMIYRLADYREDVDVRICSWCKEELP